MVWRDSSTTIVGSLGQEPINIQIEESHLVCQLTADRGQPENYNLVNSRGSGLKKM